MTKDSDKSSVRWLDVVPALWLAFVAAGLVLFGAFAHGLFSFVGGDSSGEELMTWSEGALRVLERGFLPLLCLLGVAAIIRYFCLRNGRSVAGAAEPAPERVEGRNTQ